jgi:predicted nucleic acid-binding protein
VSHLLDVSLLLACGWSEHARHAQANRWLNKVAAFATCPLTEMGFLRVSMSPAFRASFEDARTILNSLLELESHRFVTDTIRAKSLPALTSRKDVTDAHLIGLARRRGLKLATLDDRLCQRSWAAGVAENPL